jgi:hypothetical protein
MKLFCRITPYYLKNSIFLKYFREITISDIGMMAHTCGSFYSSDGDRRILVHGQPGEKIM